MENISNGLITDRNINAKKLLNSFGFRIVGETGEGLDTKCEILNGLLLSGDIATKLSQGKLAGKFDFDITKIQLKPEEFRGLIGNMIFILKMIACFNANVKLTGLTEIKP